MSLALADSYSSSQGIRRRIALGAMSGTSVFINPNASDGNTIHYCCGKKPGDCAGAN